jgi:hypothetical protein
MPDEQPLLNVIAENRQGILAVVTRAGYPHRELTSGHTPSQSVMPSCPPLLG